VNEVQCNETRVELPAAADPNATAEAGDSIAMMLPGDAGEISEPGPSAESIEPPARRKLVEQFERWLDRMAEGEAPPEGIPAEIIDDARQEPARGEGLASDLYSLFSALTTLSGEVRLQGRTFKSLTDALAPLGQLPGRLERIEGAQGMVIQDIARRAAADSQAAGPKTKEVLSVMFDLYDRLERGMGTFEKAIETLQSRRPAGWRRRLLGDGGQDAALVDAAEAIEEGYRLTLSRIDAAFVQWGVERIAAEGETFDPESMAVIEVQPAPGVADGTVLEVYKNGYLLHGRVLTTAQVKVCRNV
jgi:molecular chaperone GrpE